jgi:hypothetical protein
MRARRDLALACAPQGARADGGVSASLLRRVQLRAPARARRAGQPHPAQGARDGAPCSACGRRGGCAAAPRPRGSAQHRDPVVWLRQYLLSGDPAGSRAAPAPQARLRHRQRVVKVRAARAALREWLAEAAYCPRRQEQGAGGARLGRAVRRDHGGFRGGRGLLPRPHDETGAHSPVPERDRRGFVRCAARPATGLQESLHLSRGHFWTPPQPDGHCRAMGAGEGAAPAPGKAPRAALLHRTKASAT